MNRRWIVSSFRFLATWTLALATAAGLAGPADAQSARRVIRVAEPSELIARLDERKVGDVVKLRVLREGRETEVSAKLAAGN